MLDSERYVRVVDFGFGNNWHKDRQLTTHCGSPFYAAPEMVSGTPYIGPETVGPWVSFYILVYGRLSFDASDLSVLLAQIRRGNYQKPHEGSIGGCAVVVINTHSSIEFLSNLTKTSAHLPYNTLFMISRKL